MVINTMGTVRDARGISTEENTFNVVSIKDDMQKPIEEVKEEEEVKNESIESELEEVHEEYNQMKKDRADSFSDNEDPENHFNDIGGLQKQRPKENRTVTGP